VIEIGPASENEMVLAFLRAEVDSPRFGQYYKPCLNQLREMAGSAPQSLIDDADLGSSRDNALRIELLKAIRGYRANQRLFIGFPDDAQWRRVGLEPSDWYKVKYAKHPTWVALSGGTRIVADGAKNLGSVDAPEDSERNIKAVEAQLRRGKRYAELIGAAGPAGEIILVEGHTRATAYALAQLPDLAECILGSSPTMSSWAFY
jgi:hypothetical protein